jgi:hypothetical protein
MDIRQYVDCFSDKHPDQQYRKEIKITKVGFIHMKTGPHIHIDPKEFFNISRIDHRNFMELKSSDFAPNICMSDTVMIIKHYNVFYHFDMHIDTNVKMINYVVGNGNGNGNGSVKRHRDDEREIKYHNRKSARIVECDDNDNSSLIRYSTNQQR